MTPEQRQNIRNIVLRFAKADNLSGLAFEIIQCTNDMLAQARADALEEAARVCDEYSQQHQTSPVDLNSLAKLEQAKADAAEDLATAIRARKDA